MPRGRSAAGKPNRDCPKTFEENDNQKAQGTKEDQVLHRVPPRDIDTILVSQSGSFLRRRCTEIAISGYRTNKSSKKTRIRRPKEQRKTKFCTECLRAT